MSETKSSKDETVVRPRPLSPHLQIYAPQLTSITSILHRVTGVANTIGLVILSALLYGAANNADLYYCVTQFMTSTFGLVILSGFAISYSYHLCTGLRHFVFDAGAMMDLKNAYRLSYILLSLATLLSLFLIFKIWTVLG